MRHICSKPFKNLNDEDKKRFIEHLEMMKDVVFRNVDWTAIGMPNVIQTMRRVQQVYLPVHYFDDYELHNNELVFGTIEINSFHSHCCISLCSLSWKCCWRTNSMTSENEVKKPAATC